MQCANWSNLGHSIEENLLLISAHDPMGLEKRTVKYCGLIFTSFATNIEAEPFGKCPESPLQISDRLAQMHFF